MLEALDALGRGRELGPHELERLLNDGCARAHALERRAIQLEHRGRAAVRAHGDLDAFASIRRERRVVTRELDVLRGRLALLRRAGRQSQVR